MPKINKLFNTKILPFKHTHTNLLDNLLSNFHAKTTQKST